MFVWWRAGFKSAIKTEQPRQTELITTNQGTPLEDQRLEHNSLEVWKIIFLSSWVLCRFHVNLPGCISEIVWFFHWQRKRGSKNSSFTWSSIQNVYGIKTHIHISSFFRPGSLFRWLHLKLQNLGPRFSTRPPHTKWLKILFYDKWPSEHLKLRPSCGELHGGIGFGLDLPQWQPWRFWGFPVA